MVWIIHTETESKQIYCRTGNPSKEFCAAEQITEHYSIWCVWIWRGSFALARKPFVAYISCVVCVWTAPNDTDFQNNEWHNNQQKKIQRTVAEDNPDVWSKLVIQEIIAYIHNRIENTQTMKHICIGRKLT